MTISKMYGTAVIQILLLSSYAILWMGMLVIPLKISGRNSKFLTKHF